MTNLKPLQQDLQYEFKQINILEQALTHRSFSRIHNERMEFLGDGLVNFVVASMLYQRYSDSKEGELTSMRAKLVCRETLAELAREFSLGNYVRLGSSLLQGGNRYDSILCDLFEAVMGAIYLDSDFNTVAVVLKSIFYSRVDKIAQEGNVRDAKSRLQEWLQGRAMDAPEYKLVETTGPAHERYFSVSCQLNNHSKLSNFPKSGVLGTGKSRRLAEQQAAQQALELLSTLNPL